jgi:hypothetical protein
MVRGKPVGKGDVMGHWIAIGRQPAWTDVETFTNDMKATTKWRVDPRTTITEVVVLADGRMLAECHAARQEDFDAWLQRTGWEVESVTQIKCLARTGEVWKVG